MVIDQDYSRNEKGQGSLDEIASTKKVKKDCVNDFGMLLMRPYVCFIYQRVCVLFGLSAYDMFIYRWDKGKRIILDEYLTL